LMAVLSSRAAWQMAMIYSSATRSNRLDVRKLASGAIILLMDASRLGKRPSCLISERD
jgi:hypothetical protein